MAELNKAEMGIELARNALRMHADSIKMLAEAEANGDRAAAAQLRKTVADVEKLIKSYGLERHG